MFCILYFCAAVFTDVFLLTPVGSHKCLLMSFSSVSLAAQWRRRHGPKFNLFMFGLWHFLRVQWRSLQVDALVTVLITVLVSFSVTINCVTTLRRPGHSSSSVARLY